MHNLNHTMDIIAMNQSTQTKKTVSMNHDMKRTIITTRNHTEKIAMDLNIHPNTLTAIAMDLNIHPNTLTAIAMDLNIHPNTLTAIAMNQQHQVMEMTITTIGNPMKPIAMNQQQAMEWMTITTKKIMKMIIAMTSHNTNHHLIKPITSHNTHHMEKMTETNQKMIVVILSTK